jgi:hypothetical protein
MGSRLDRGDRLLAMPCIAAAADWGQRSMRRRQSRQARMLRIRRVIWLRLVIASGAGSVE